MMSRICRQAKPSLAFGLGGLKFLSFPNSIPEFVELRTETLGVAIGCESSIPLVWSAHAKRMFDRTPVLLGTAGCFPGVGNDPVRIAAVRAIQLLYAVQISQAMPVDDYIVGSFDSLHSPSGETDELEDIYTEV